MERGDTLIFANEKEPRIKAEYFAGSNKYYTQSILQNKIDNDLYGNYFYFRNDKLDRYTFYCGDSIEASYELHFDRNQNVSTNFGNPFANEMAFGDDSVLTWVSNYSYDSVQLFRYISSKNVQIKIEPSKIQHMPFVKGYAIEKDYKDSLILICFRDSEVFSFPQN